MRQKTLQDEQITAVCNSLKANDQYFKSLNKKIILVLIEDLIKPRKKESRLIRDELKRDLIYNSLQTVLSSIYPNTMAKQREMYNEWRNQPEQNRKRELKIADFILENITHSRRIEYFEDVLREGLLIANNSWRLRGIKFRRAEEN
jgi:hypothetical protein